MAAAKATAPTVLLDTNVLMELFFHRAKYDSAVRAITALDENILRTVSVLSLATFFYYVESEGLSKDAAHAFIAGFQLLPVLPEDYEWARANDGGDFEDALQVACALRHNCAKIVTLDQNFARMYGKYIAVQTIH